MIAVVLDTAQPAGPLAQLTQPLGDLSNDAVTAIAAAALTDLAHRSGAEPPRHVLVRDHGHSRATALRHIYLKRGDLGRPSTAGLLAHELAHTIDPNSTARLAAMGLILATTTTLALALLATFSPLTGVGLLMMVAGLLVVLAIKRRSEFAADAIAAELLGDTQPVLQMLDELAGFQREWNQTHPSPKRRRAALSAPN